MKKKAKLIRCVASLLAGSVLTLFLAAGGEACVAQQPFAACSDEFWHEQPPVLAAQGPLYALCASHFATLYSGLTETPLYSAEHLTAQQIDDAIHLPRHGDFHEDHRLPATSASTLEEYRDSGFDRGHRVPSGDETDWQSQYESFALSNIVPQNANDNRYLWADIEMAVRELVLSGGDDVYVVTGPLFNPKGAEALRGAVEVPTFIYKAVDDHSAGFAGVYVARNAPGLKFWKLSLANFQQRFGINPFPALGTGIESDGGELPDPVLTRSSGN